MLHSSIIAPKSKTSYVVVKVSNTLFEYINSKSTFSNWSSWTHWIKQWSTCFAFVDWTHLGENHSFWLEQSCQNHLKCTSPSQPSYANDRDIHITFCSNL